MAQQSKAISAFEILLPSQLPTSKNDCPICRDPVGGKMDTLGIKLNICCGQTSGLHCLQCWFESMEMGKQTCPNCRFSFPVEFVEAVLKVEEKLVECIDLFVDGTKEDFLWGNENLWALGGVTGEEIGIFEEGYNGSRLYSGYSFMDE